MSFETEMMNLKSATRLLLLTTLMRVSALAQVRYCIAGDLDDLSPAQKSSCHAKLDAVHRVATALHAPDDWHFVLVCGERGWENYSAYSRGEANALAGHDADTNFEEHETFLRETRLNAGELVSMQGIIAREVASAVLRSNDEVAIRKEVARRSSISGVPEGI